MESRPPPAGRCPTCQRPQPPGESVCAACGSPLDEPPTLDARLTWAARPGPAAAPPAGPAPTAPEPPAAEPLAPGSRLGPAGRYRVVALIGRGGFAETYLAADGELFDSRCVVKRVHLSPEQGPSIQAVKLASIAREAGLLVDLKTPGHPNIPEVYAYLADERCLVMKYVEGVSLQALLRQAPTGLPEAEALRYAHDACSALAYIHARGILHLDVKPDNLLRDSAGRLWLIDFGIGRSAAGQPDGPALGTLGYTPPEQWQRAPVPRSDVYALGASLYALLTGQRPLDDLPRLAALRPEVGQLIRRATDPDPRRRPDAADMLADLARLRSGIGVPRPARPPALAPLVGRAAELERCQDLLDRGGGAALTGMPGVGKTALAVALAARAARPELLFWHSFQPGEGFEALLWALGAFLAWDGRPELWELLQRSGQSGPPPQVLLDYLLGQLAGRPYLLCLDDYHHAEGDRWVAELTAALRARGPEGGPRLLLTARQLADPPADATVVLAGLPADAARQMLAASGPPLDPALAAGLVAACEGVPQILLLAGDALRRSERPAALLERLAGVERIERYLLREVDDTLSADERTAMRALAALLGAPAPRPLLEALAGDRSLRRPLRALVDRHLITVAEGAAGVEYRQHAIVQGFYYDDLSAAERLGLHRRAARHYAAEGAHTQAARHHLLAGEPEPAADLATRDPWAAVNQGQAGLLLQLLGQLPAAALGRERGMRVLLARGEIAALLGQGAAARAAYAAADAGLAAWPPGPERMLLSARVCQGMGDLLETEAPQEALGWLRRGLAALDGPAPRERARLRLRVGSVLIGAGDFAAALAAIEAGLAELPDDAAVERADALTNQATIALLQGDAAAAEARSRAALAIYEEAGQRWKMLSIWQNLGVGKQFAGDWPGAAAEYERARAAARELGSQIRQADLALCLGALAISQGDDAAARAHIDEGLAIAQRHQMHELQISALSNLGDLLTRMGDHAAAAAALDEAAALAAQLGVGSQLSEIRREQAELRLAQGAIAAALEAAEQARAIAVEQANPREEGMALRALAQALIAAGRDAEAHAAFGQSLGLLDDQDPYEAARARAAWAAARDDNAGQALREAARATFLRLGARRDLAALDGSST